MEGIWKGNLTVDRSLVTTLYNLPRLSPEDEKNNTVHASSIGIRVGNMEISKGYTLLEHQNCTIQTFKKRISELLVSFVNGPIWISESFFNINKAGSEVNPHNHLQPRDEELKFNSQKYSLVYYLNVGDRRATSPGMLTFDDLDFSIKPQDGDIILFPSAKSHSASYNGLVDRVILGINFYRT